MTDDPPVRRPPTRLIGEQVGRPDGSDKPAFADALSCNDFAACVDKSMIEFTGVPRRGPEMPLDRCRREAVTILKADLLRRGNGWMAKKLRIEDYALIGDCATAALVGRNGSIDWLCLPRFDSAACFAALLGEPEHGRWLIAPVDPAARVTRRYRGASLVLETVFETAEGKVALIDLMRPHHSPSHLVRLVRGLRGNVAMCTEFILRFEYGAVVPWVERLPEGGISAIGGPDRVVLRTPAPLRGEDMKTVGEFTVGAGATVPFTLSWGPSHLPPPRPIDPERALEDAETFWHRWSDRCAAAGPWTDMVKRSLVVLKGLTYAPTGGIVAAPTTSLPEQLGGARNWDYRFCWLRDATFTLLALMHGGYYDEARDWRDWLFRAVAGSPDQLQVIYGIAGERRLTEWEVPWLPGYEESRPVRIGNGAVDQTQLDVYGEVVDARSEERRVGKECRP